MSFIVRQISRTADGREIVRPTRFDQAELSVGRDPSCDIHLPDLAVTLQHAVIREGNGGLVEIVASAGIPFDVNGRQAERAEVDPAKGADIRFGSHVLAVARGEGDEAGAVILSVERVGALSDASEAKDEQKVFSLASALPGKRRMAWSLALLVLALGLLWPILAFYTNGAAEAGERRPTAFHADELWSTGKLSVAHAGLENNCKACHQQPGVVVADESCVACHTDVHDHADPRRLAAAPARPDALGQAGRAISAAFNRPPGRCAECHIEHEGRTRMPTTPQKFCADCHTDLSKRLTDTKILDASDFGTAQGHPQFRPVVTTRAGAVPTVQRLSLDARPLEDNGLKFPHALHLSTSNGVARMAATLGGRAGFGKALVCADCHVPDASGTRFRPVEMEKNCQMCHDLAFDKVGPTYRTLRHGDPAQVVAELRAFYRSGGPTQPIGLEGMRRRPGDFAASRAPTYAGSADAAINAVFSKGGACYDCHTITRTREGAFAITPVRLPDRYMSKGWFDHKAHSTESCESCHAAKTSRSAADVLLPKVESCRACHGGEDAHKAVPSSCAMCHDYHMSEGTPRAVRDARVRGKLLDSPRRAVAAASN
jgi:hypothetical protein